MMSPLSCTNMVKGLFRSHALYVVVILSAVLCFVAASPETATDEAPRLSPDHPAIQYSSRPPQDSVTKLNQDIQQGKLHLDFAGDSGYLRSVLKALNVPVESQMLVFSKTSAQARLISPRNPRSLFFNDSVTVGWVPGGMVEVAADDPQQGIMFYVLQQKATDKPAFVRTEVCLLCHVFDATLGVVGTYARSVPTAADGTALPQLSHYFSDHRSPYEERWGGWYVTGRSGSLKHMGNTITSSADRKETMLPKNADGSELRGVIDMSTYLSPYSDIVALMVFDHQVRMANLFTRLNWEFRYASYERNKTDMAPKDIAHHAQGPAFSLADSAKEVVDYMLFIDEAPLSSLVEGTSGFAEEFAASGLHDGKGRSLRQFDLHRRMMKYPCSYMIYSPAFDALPAEAKQAVYKRLWQVLSGQEDSARYARLSRRDRQDIVEILRATKRDLPDYFQSVRH